MYKLEKSYYLLLSLMQKFNLNNVSINLAGLFTVSLCVCSQ